MVLKKKTVFCFFLNKNITPTYKYAARILHDSTPAKWRLIHQPLQLWYGCGPRVFNEHKESMR